MNSENKKIFRTLADMAHHYYESLRLVEEHEPNAAMYVPFIPTVYKYILPRAPHFIAEQVRSKFPESAFIRKHEYLAAQIYTPQEITEMKQRQQTDHQERTMYQEFKDLRPEFERFRRQKQTCIDNVVEHPTVQ